jgi:D-xylose reductase
LAVAPQGGLGAWWGRDTWVRSTAIRAAPMHQTWGAMETLIDSGLTRNLGLCNVGAAMLRDVASYARLQPQVLQVELHPHLSQQKLLQFCDHSSRA